MNNYTIYSEVLTLNLLTSVATVGFADNTGLTIVARLLEEVEVYVNETVYDIKSWHENEGK